MAKLSDDPKVQALVAKGASAAHKAAIKSVADIIKAKTADTVPDDHSKAVKGVLKSISASIKEISAPA